MKLETYEDAEEAIKDMTVRGAPLIGATAAYGIYLAVREMIEDELDGSFLDQAFTDLRASRPTAVNLFWALDKMREALDNCEGDFLQTAWEAAAAIVEEETNYDSDKSLIASVYQNRIKKSMPLQACPTIKFAMQDFGLTRIYEKYLSNPSPYNTYNHRGLPPGPICTPSPKTIDIVLDAPSTDYLYFVAKADFSGYHHFSSTYEEHNQFAKEYQKQLDIYQQKKAQKAK